MNALVGEVMAKVGGYRRDVQSSKDWLFDQMGLAAATGMDTYVLKELTPISDQGALNSCVGNATCDALEILLGLEGNEVVQLSRLDLYWKARKLNNDTDKDDGTYITSAFKAMATLGVCPESLFPYDESKVFTEPPVSALLSGNANKITGYYRIPVDYRAAGSIETAVRSNHPVVFGAPVDKAFVHLVGDKVVYKPNLTNLAGGHAMIIVGVRNYGASKQFLVRNSWGTDWGENGHVWMDAQYVSYMNDIWVPTRVQKIL